MTRARMLRLAPLLLLALPLLFYHQLAFGRMIFARGDAFNYFYPYWDARNEAWRAGQLPLWTDDLFMGAPLLANPQIGVYYPPNWLTAPLRAPDAITLSILLHIALAGLGMAWLYRQVEGESPLAALTAGAVYAFGGVLAAHVEQINQLQGLAWMPVLFALFHRVIKGERNWRGALLLGMAWALQIFSGHTQTVFISGVGLFVYALANGGGRRGMARAILWLAACFALALALAIPQLLPSLELMGMSNRGGGFNLQEATAFSLPPALLGRALLPSYDAQLFGEYVAYTGVIGMGLALLAARRGVWLLLAGVGLALALGRYNPLYLVIGELPGFDLFRVPARFLALYSLGMAMLAGRGMAMLTTRAYPPPDSTGGPRGVIAGVQRGVIAGPRGVIVLLSLILATRFVLNPAPEHFYGASTVTARGLGLWLGASALLVVLMYFRRRWTPPLAFVLIVAELFIAAQSLPDKDLAPPEVYLGQRFTISQLNALNDSAIAPGRALSISRLYFDPGDLSALRARYEGLGMDEQAQGHALDAVKKQEMLMPNQSLAWGIPTLDGFGGGIMPGNAYTQFATLLLPDEAPRAVDGRLGERMAHDRCRGACLPDLRWLRMTDTRWLLTDKIHDLWHEGVAYDRTLARYWRGAAEVELPDYTDQARVLHTAPLADSSSATELPDGTLLTTVPGGQLDAIVAQDIGVIAITAVNSRHTSIFTQQQPPGFVRVLSSDIEIYQLPAGQRALLVSAPAHLPDDWQGRETALDMLRGGAKAVIHGAPELPAQNLDGASVEITAHESGRVALRVESPAPAYLLLADSWHPGWTAAVNGEASPVYRANVMFRAVAVPAGQSEAVFLFQPRMWQVALVVGVVMWLVVGLLWFLLPPLVPPSGRGEANAATIGNSV